MARDPNLPEYSYARRRGQPAVDPALRRIAIMAGVVSVVVIVVALAWSGLRPRLGFGGAPPVIAAPAAPPDLSQLQQQEAAAPAKPVAAKAAPVVAAPAHAPVAVAPAVSAAATGPVAVQLAATATLAAAHAAWYAALHAQPALLAAHKPLFIPVTVNGKPVVRLRVPGFADHAAAAGFCAALAAKGVACAVASF